MQIDVQLRYTRLLQHRLQDLNLHIIMWQVDYPWAGVLVRKLSQLTPLSKAKQANPKYFSMLCGMSCELSNKRSHRLHHYLITRSFSPQADKKWQFDGFIPLSTLKLNPGPLAD